MRITYLINLLINKIDEGQNKLYLNSDTQLDKNLQ